MKPVHLICNKSDLRPYVYHISITNGFVCVSDSYTLIKVPVNEVFGEGTISPDETLCVTGEAFKMANAHKATHFKREGNRLDAYSGAKLIGTMLLAAPDYKIPDFDAVIPDGKNAGLPDGRIAFNFKQLRKTCEAFGKVSVEGFRFTFNGPAKSILVQHTDCQNITAIVVPLLMAE